MKRKLQSPSNKGNAQLTFPRKAKSGKMAEVQAAKSPGAIMVQRDFVPGGHRKVVLPSTQREEEVWGANQKVVRWVLSKKSLVTVAFA